MASVSVDVTPTGIALVTMSRPERLNALRLADVVEFLELLDTIDRDDRVRVVVLTGAGRGFCSGHDLSEFAGSPEVVEQYDVQEAFAHLTARVCSLRVPVIAAVNGPAAGGGLALALASDTRVCAESAVFNAAFVRLGLSGCDVGVSYLLPKVVGSTLAFEMMLTGRLVDADEAARSGLVLRMVPDGEVVSAAFQIAEQICANSPFGIRMTKQVMRANLDAPSLDAAIQVENRAQIVCTHTRDHTEAVRAFRDRRPAAFTNT